MDHIGGILDAEGKIAYPNASFIMLVDSWHYWATGESRAELGRLNKWAKGREEVAWGIYSKIKDLIHPVKSGEEFLTGFRLFAAPGHRYDHSGLHVTSADKQLMHISNALAHPLFMAKRYWVLTYDANPNQAIATKEKLLSMCVSEKMLVFAAHFPFPGLGYVEQEGERWKWLPIEMG